MITCLNVCKDRESGQTLLLLMQMYLTRGRKSLALEQLVDFVCTMHTRYQRLIPLIHSEKQSAFSFTVCFQNVQKIQILNQIVLHLHTAIFLWFALSERA